MVVGCRALRKAASPPSRLAKTWNEATTLMSGVMSQPIQRLLPHGAQLPVSPAAVERSERTVVARLREHCGRICEEVGTIRVPKDSLHSLRGFEDFFAGAVLQSAHVKHRHQSDAHTIVAGELEAFDGWIDAHFPDPTASTLSVAEMCALVDSYFAFRRGVTVGTNLISSPIRPLFGAPVPARDERRLMLDVGYWVRQHKRDVFSRHEGRSMRGESVAGISALVAHSSTGITPTLLLKNGAHTLTMSAPHANWLRCCEASVQALWKSREVAHTGRSVDMLLGEALPASTALSQKYNLLTFEMTAPPLLPSPVAVAEFGKAWHLAPGTLRRFCEDVGAQRQGGIMSDSTCHVSILHNNFYDLVAALTDDAQRDELGVDGFLARNPVRSIGASGTAASCGELHKPTFHVVHSAHQSLALQAAPILSGNPLLSQIEHGDERRLAEAGIQSFYGKLRQELVIFERRVPLLKARAMERPIGAFARGGSTLQVPWKDTFEYNNYLPKSGPTNPFHFSERVQNFSYLDDDLDHNADDFVGEAEEVKKMRTLNSEVRAMASSQLVDFTHPGTGASYNAEAARRFSSLFSDELTAAKRASDTKQRAKQLRKLVGQARSTRELYLDKKALKSHEAQVAIINQLERFDWSMPR